MTIREEIRPFHEIGIRNAVARIVRRRWPMNTQREVAVCWGLSAGEAANVVYARCSLSALEKIVRHKKNGGWRIVLEIFGHVVRQSLDEFVTSEQRRLERELAKTVALLHIVPPVAGNSPSAADLGVQRKSWTERKQNSTSDNRDNSKAEGG